MKRGGLYFFIISIICLVFFTYSYAEDIIKMKDGKVYKGVIVSYKKGKYTIMINSKKYTIPESEVSRIWWLATQPELDVNLVGEKISDSRLKDENPFRLYLKTELFRLTPFSQKIMDVYTNGMQGIGGSIGFDQNLDGGALGFMVGGGEGKSTLDSYGTLSDVKLKASFFNLYIIKTQRFLKDFFIQPCFELGVGFQLMTEEADFVFGPMKKTYPGMMGKLLLGADIKPLDFLTFDIKAGYFADSQRSTPRLISYPVQDSDIIVNYALAQYLYIGAGIRYVF